MPTTWDGRVSNGDGAQDIEPRQKAPTIAALSGAGRPAAPKASVDLGHEANPIGADVGLARFSDSLTRLLQDPIPRYAAEGRSYLATAIGCTGGRRRPAFAAECPAAAPARDGRFLDVHHRNLAGAQPMSSHFDVLAGSVA
jgi:hypothetical protein